MHRFVAVLWDPTMPAAASRAKSWTSALSRESGPWSIILRRDGLHVYVPKGAHAFATLGDITNPDGVIVGRLFERGYEKQGRLGALSKDAARHVKRSQGDELIRSYWGQYVALWSDAERGQTAVLRDPSGAVPAFRYSDSGAELIFAHAGDVVGVGIQRVSINWPRVHAFLQHNYFTTEVTGICEFTELAAGKRLVCKSGGETLEQWTWNPAAVAAEPDLRGLDEIEAELRETVSTCFNAFGSQFPRTLVQLSGGLDSSILLALLKKAPGGEVFALHTVAQGYEGYESELARMMATHTRTEFITRDLSGENEDLTTILNIPLLSRPDRQIMGMPGNALIESVCAELSIDVVMAGHGGDSLFLQRSAASQTLPDYIRLNGWTSDVMSIAYDAAMLEQRSVWAVLRGAFKALRSRSEWDPYAFLSGQPTGGAELQIGENEANARQHPWLLAAKDLPPGKAMQVSYLVGLLNYYLVLGYALTREAIDPYLSQPIIEFALRIPTYQFGRGGTDRSLQRRAFGDLLPSAIRRRTGKGFLNNHILRGIERNAEFLRELLHDGELVKRGVLRRDDIDPLFSHESLVDGSGMTMINSLAATEAWLHAWRRADVLAA